MDAHCAPAGNGQKEQGKPQGQRNKGVDGAQELTLLASSTRSLVSRELRIENFLTPSDRNFAISRAMVRCDGWSGSCCRQSLSGLSLCGRRPVLSGLCRFPSSRIHSVGIFSVVSVHKDRRQTVPGLLSSVHASCVGSHAGQNTPYLDVSDHFPSQHTPLYRALIEN